MLETNKHEHEVRHEHPGRAPHPELLGKGMGKGQALPHGYVLNELVVDFWSLLKLEWAESKHFGIAGL